MKIDSLYSGLKLLILGVILNYISGCTNLLDTISPSYIKAYTHTEDLYIKKDDFLKVAKSKKVESYQDICSLLDSNRYNFSYLYIPPRIPISIPNGLKEKEALFYVTLVDILPDLLIKHKVLIYNSKSNKKVRYYYKVNHGEIYFYLNDGTLFYSSVQSIIDWKIISCKIVSYWSAGLCWTHESDSDTERGVL